MSLDFVEAAILLLAILATLGWLLRLWSPVSSVVGEVTVVTFLAVATLVEDAISSLGGEDSSSDLLTITPNLKFRTRLEA